MVYGLNVKLGDSSTYDNHFYRTTHIYEGTSEHLPVFGFALSSVDIEDQIREAKPEKTPVIPFEVTFKGQSHWPANYYPFPTLIQHYDLVSVTRVDLPLPPVGITYSTHTFDYLEDASPTNSSQVTYQGVKIVFSGTFTLPPEQVHISYRDGLDDVVTTHYVEEVTGEVTKFVKDPDIIFAPMSFRVKDGNSPPTIFTANFTVATRPIFGIPWDGFPIPPN